ncbi:MAG: hypothetical protein FWG50_00345 [Kiritimatiellaeota bacterium]|nr:hypothetical protein [Kiritimatiellota bacterium]
MIQKTKRDRETLKLLKKYFKVSEIDQGKEQPSGYDLEDLVGFDGLDTWIFLNINDTPSVCEAFLNYVDNFDLYEPDDSCMREEVIRKKLLEIAKEVERTL